MRDGSSSDVRIRGTGRDGRSSAAALRVNVRVAAGRAASALDRFDISERDEVTEIHFTHVGLVPQYECFEAHQDAWGMYIQDSLRSLIATGVRKPTRREIDAATAELRASLAAR